MMPYRPLFKVLGQQERACPVLFLGRNIIQGEQRQVDCVRGPNEEANQNSDPKAYTCFTHVPSYIKSLACISFFKTH